MKDKVLRHKSEVERYEVSDVQYRGVKSFPFKLLGDLPRIFMDNILPVMKFRYSVTDKSGRKLAKFRDNELIRFVKFNESGIANLVVYLFWIVVQVFFQDHKEQINLTKEFIDEIKLEANAQYKKIYCGYLIRINRDIMDAILEILPFFLTRTVKYCLAVKLRGHGLPLEKDKTFCLIFSVIFYELFGHKMTDYAILKGKKRYINKEPIYENNAAKYKAKATGTQLQKHDAIFT